MLRKRKARAATPADPPAVLVPAASPGPVNVVIVVESRRRRRRHASKADGKEGHPLLKTALGLAVAKRLLRRRKRPLRKRVGKAVRRGRRKVKKATRRVRRALR